LTGALELIPGWGVYWQTNYPLFGAENMKNTPFWLIALFALFAIILTACAGTPAPAGTTWKLASYGPAGNPTLAAPDVETSVAFGSDGLINGTVGCNSFSGSFKVSGSQVTFDALASTLMACEDALMQQESGVFAVLTGTANFKMDGDTLTISSADGATAVTFKK
jgi:heat shock protein HslJ